MKIPKKLVDFVMRLGGGLSQGEEHHNPVRVPYCWKTGCFP